MRLRVIRTLTRLWNSGLQRLMIGDSGPVPAVAGHEGLASTLNAIPDLMFELDEDGRHLDFRALRPELLVAPPETLLGRTVADVMPPEAAESVMRTLREAANDGHAHGTQICLPTPVGERWFEVSMARKAGSDDSARRFIALSRDITERKTQQIEAEKLAYFDGLTGLPNRYLLKKSLQSRAVTSELKGQFGALLFMDLNNFKILNDTHGHSTGDQLLKLVAERLRSAVRGGDLVVRWGGDEFVALITPLASSRDEAEKRAREICEQIVQRTNRPYELNGCTHLCPVSIGVKVFENLREDFEELVEHADKAMYRAKKSGESQYVMDGS